VDYRRPSASEERRECAFGFLIILGTWLILAWTAPRIPIVWDEGEYLFRADEVVSWFRLLFSIHHPQGGMNAFSDAVIQHHWRFVRSVEGHPSWFAIPIALGKALLSGPLHPLTAARLGPITVFSVACGTVALRLKRDYGTIAALVAPIALLTLPRMFSDAHFAAQDGQLTAWWLLVFAADASPQRGMRTTLGVGILLGLTCATKFTGWFAVLPLIAWRAVTRDREACRELCVVLPIALLTFCAVNPPLWHAPVVGLVEYFRLNFARPDSAVFGSGSSRSPAIDLRQYLVGSMHYGNDQPYLPWYNTIVWLAVATPLPTLVLGVIGLRHCSGTRVGTRCEALPPSIWVSRVAWLPEPGLFALILHWGTLMVVRALPGAPPNDGIRLFLPAFGFWCVLAGIGAGRVWSAASCADGRFARRTAVGALLGGTFAAAAINEARYYPQTLSHYNLLVGGVRGAASIGMEPTYWWDALDADVLDWLNSHTEAGARVAFSEGPAYNLALLRGWGRLRTEISDPSWGIPFTWYVLQNRPSTLTNPDRLLIRSEKPVFTKYAGHRARGVPADLNVPLILVFSYEQYRAAAAKSIRSELPSGAPVPEKAGY